MDALAVIEQRLTYVERAAEQARQDHDVVRDHDGRLRSIEDNITQIRADVVAIRSAQGRNFIVSLIAATASLGTIGGILLTLGGG